MKRFFKIFVAVAISMVLVTPASTPSYGSAKKAQPKAKAALAKKTFGPNASLSVEPAKLDASVATGGGATETFILLNEGSATMGFSIEEFTGGYSRQARSAAKPKMQLKWHKQNANSPPKAASTKAAQVSPKAKISLSAAKSAKSASTRNSGGLLSFWDASLLGAFGIAFVPLDDNSTDDNGTDDNSTDDNGTVWISSSASVNAGDNTVHQYSNGVQTGLSFGPDPEVVPISDIKDLAYNFNTGMLWVMDSRIGDVGSNCISEIDPVLGFTGNSICPNSTGFSSAQNGLAYDPMTNSFFAAGAEDKKIYRFKPDGTMLDAVDVGLAVYGLAYNPDTKHLFAMVGTSEPESASVYVLDAANGYAPVSEFPPFVIDGFSPSGAAGLSIDCQGNLWALDKTAEKVFVVETGEQSSICSKAGDVPWMSEDLISGTILAGESAVVTVTFDATDPGIVPGVYRAKLKVSTSSATSSPADYVFIPVTMTVVEAGYVQVEITPSAATNKGAKWKVDGGSWHLSGETESVFPGSHMVYFDQAQGYFAPEPVTINVESGQTESVTGRYTVAGKLKITLGPASVLEKGAKWQVDGGAWHTSGQLVSVPAGLRRITCINVDGYAAPDPVRVYIPGNTAKYLSLNYLPLGSLTVNITPPEVAAAGGQWQVDDGPWQESGQKLELAAGDYTVNFKPLKGYVTPEPKSIKIVGGDAQTVSGGYVAGGTLKVTISPRTAINKGAMWKAGNGEWMESGEVVELPVGAHTVSFRDVEGFAAPQPKSVSIAAGDSKLYEASYVQGGTLTVNLSPDDAVAKGAQWKVDEGAWQNSGARVSLSPGIHTVSFHGAKGYVTPEPKTVRIVSGGTQTVNQRYVRPGMLKVTITPEGAVAKGAQWQVDGGDWMNSNDVVTLAPGRHKVSYKEIDGYSTPADKVVTVSAGQATRITGEYSSFATLTVTITPAGAIRKGARWRLQGELRWRASGDSMRLEPGKRYTVAFKAATGYTAPAKQSFTPEAGEQKTITGVYKVK